VVKAQLVHIWVSFFKILFVGQDEISSDYTILICTQYYIEIGVWKITNVLSVKNAVRALENKIMKYFIITAVPIFVHSQSFENQNQYRFKSNAIHV